MKVGSCVWLEIRGSRILDEVDRGGSEEAWSCYIPFCAA
jgi:hypothetical protein